MQRGTRADAATASEAVVRPLRELADFTVADGDPDVRGWAVQTRDGTEIGRVWELMVDTAERRIRYLDVATVGGGQLLVPVEKMNADPSRRAVHVDGVMDTTRTRTRTDTEREVGGR